MGERETGTIRRVYTMPDKKLLIVRVGRTWPRGWDDAVRLNVIWKGTKTL